MVEHQDYDGDDAEFAAAQRRAAFAYVNEAFVEGQMDGIEGDCLAQAALFAAFKHLVETYGEEAVATYAERLPDRLRNGEFTVERTRQ